MHTKLCSSLKFFLLWGVWAVSALAQTQATTTSIASSANPVGTGRTVVITATVSPIPSSGTVTLLDGTNNLGTTAVSGGTAAFNPSFATAGTHNLTASYSGGGTFTGSTSSVLVQTVNPTPVITSVVDAGNSASPPLAPGSHAVINGSNLAGSMMMGSFASALPTTLGGVSITVNGTPAGLWWVQSGQVNFQIPYGTPTGPSIPVVITNNGIASSPFSLGIAPTAPGIFAILNPDGNANSSSARAGGGSTVLVHVTGVGATTPSIASGALAPSSPLAVPTATASVTINGSAATVSSVYMDPGVSIGLASINIVIPVAANPGIYPVVVTVGTGTSAASLSFNLYVGISTNITLTSTVNPSAVGQPVSLAASANNSDATGTFTFMDGSTTLGTMPLAAGNATFNTSALTPGSHSLTAIYSGSSGLGANTSNVVTQIVNAPTITGVFNGADFSNPPLAPGSAASIVGTFLAGATTAASGYPWPTTLGGVSVTVGGVAAPIAFVSATQINFQIPYGASGSQQVVVTNSGASSNSAALSINSTAPGFYSGPTFINAGTSGANSSGNPATAGTIVTGFLTGIGAVSPSVANGAAGPTSPVSNATAAATVTVAGVSATLGFLGLSPGGGPGFAQAGITIPPNLATGSYPVIITVGGRASAAGTIFVTAATPAISSVVNGGDGSAAPLAPGSIASVSGTSLASSSANAAGVPLPTTLAGTQVTVNGTPVPLVSVTPTQINFQIPYGSAVGSGIDVIVVKAGLSSNTLVPTIAATAPGISSPGLLNQDSSPNGSGNPAAPGSTVSVTFTGGGAVTPSVTDGAAAPSSPLSTLNAAVTATVNSVSATVAFAGLPPGTVGLDQANVTIPNSLPTGSYTLALTVGGKATSTTVYVAVPTPTITSMTNGADSTAPPLAPGSQAIIFGVSLSNVTTVASSFPLATSLGGVTVKIAGAPVPVQFVSPNQINIQIPYEATVGTASVVVTNNGAPSAGFSLSIAATAPGIATSPGFMNSNGSTNASGNPASAGSVVTAYMTGIGAVAPAVATGAAAPSSPTSAPVAGATVTVNGVAASLNFIGLVPNSNPGLAQISFIVPSSLTAGSYPVVVTVGGKPTAAAALFVSPAVPAISTSSNLGTINLGTSQIALAASGGNGTFSWSLASTAQQASCATFPAGYYPFSTINYVSSPNESGDRLVVGSMDLAHFNGISSIALPSGSNQQFCGAVSLASVGEYAAAYVPTAGERNGDFSAFAGQFIDPQTGTPFPGGILPSSRFGSIFAWRVSSALPAGMALRTDTPTFFGATQQAGLLGVANTPGNYGFNLYLTSGGQTVSGAFTLRVTALTTIDQNPPDVFVGVPFTYQFTARGNAGTVTYAAVASSPLPAGVTISSTGLLSGTVTAAASSAFAIDVSDGTDTEREFYTLNAYAIQVTTGGLLPNATVGSAYNQTLTASGGTNSFTWSINSGSLPSGLTLSPAGAITGTPAGGSGSFTVQVKATDTNSVSYSKWMSIDVLAVPVTLQRISFAPEVVDDAVVGNRFSWQISPCCGGTAPFTWSATGLPSGLAVRTGSGVTSSYIAPGYVEIYGVPSVAGTYNVTLTLTDATGATSSAAFPMNVGILDLNSLANSVSMTSGTVGTPYTFTFRILGGNAPYSSSLPLFNKLPGGLTTTGATATVSGTPNENGNFSPVYRFTDAAGNTYYRFTGITIANGSSTITISGSGFNGYDLGTATTGVSYSNSFFAAGGSGSFTWTPGSGTIPPGLSLSSGSVLSGTPNTAGNYTFVLKATDQSNSANFGLKEFTLSISALAISTATPLNFGNVGTTYSVNFAATGNVGTLTWATAYGSLLPPGLSLASNGALTGTPTSPGQYFFTLRVSDGGNANTAVRSYTLNIYPAGGAPPLFLNTSQTITTTVGIQRIQLQASGGTPPYHYSYSPESPSIPGFRVQDGQPLPTSFPTSATGIGGLLGIATAPGTYNSSIRVTDATNNIFDRAISMVVVPVAMLDQSTLPKATVGLPYTYTFSAAGGSGTYTMSATGVPSGFTFNTTTGVISDASPTTAGNFAVAITVADAAGGPGVVYNYTLAVNAFAITDAPVLPLASMGSLYTHTFSAPGCVSCVWSISSTTGTAGFTVNSASGQLSGTPTATNVFSISFTITATGSNGTVAKVFSLMAPAPTIQGLSITNTLTTTLTINSVPATQLLASGGTPPYTFALQSGTMPAGLAVRGPGENLAAALVPGAYYLAGRAQQAGTYNFTIQVTDAASRTATKAFTWVVSPMNLEYSSLPLTGTYVVSSPTTPQPLLVIGGSGNYTAWSTANSPVYPGLAMDSAGVISGTPTNTGSVTQILTVTDSAGNMLANNLTINVTSNGTTTVTLPAITGVTPVGGGTILNITPTGGTAPYTISAVGSLPAGFSILQGNAIIAGLAGSSFLYAVPQTPGANTFTLKATDANGVSGHRTYTLAATGFTYPAAAILRDGSVSVPYAQQIFQFGSSTFVYAVASGTALPPGLSISSTGLLSGTPTTAGTYAFSLAVTDSNGTLTSSYQLRISGINISSPPVLPPAIFTIPYSYTMTSTGGSGSVTWSAVNLPTGITLSTGGLLSGSTFVNPGRFVATITATDGTSTASQNFYLQVRYPNAQQLSLTINPSGDSRFLTLPDAVLNSNYTVSFAGTGGVAPNVMTLAEGSSLPPGITLIPASQLPLLQPGTTALFGSPSSVGSFTFTLLFTDAAGSQISRTYTLNVTPIGLVSGNPQSAITGISYNAQLTAFGGNAPYTFSMSPISYGQEMLPTGLTMSSSGLIGGTPTSTGSYISYLRVQDANGLSFTRTLTLLSTNASGLYINNINYVYMTTGFEPSQVFQTGGGLSTYTWSKISGAMPPGVSLLTVAGSTSLAGAPTAAGTYTYTIRATDTANSSNFADHTFTEVVGSEQIVSPAESSIVQLYLPPAQIGSSYSQSFLAAGGAPPYTFVESQFDPLPPGMTLSSSGVLSGIPSIAGSFNIRPVVTDSNGARRISFAQTLVISPNGVHSPLIPKNDNGISDGSVGAPFLLPLDRFTFGGVPPYTWTATGLPPEISVVNGSGGLTSYLSGVPATAGPIAAGVTVTDSGGQSWTRNVKFVVSPLRVMPDTIPNGQTGTFYSVALAPSGGTAPYSFDYAKSFYALPAGLSLSSSGVLSGTPTSAGVFDISVTVTDSASNSLSKYFEITIDNPAGEAPTLSITPNPVNITYALGATAPSASLSLASTSSALPFSAYAAGIPGASLTPTGGNTDASLALNINPASLAVGTYNGFVSAQSPNSTNYAAAVPVRLTVTPAAACTTTLTSSVNPSTVGQNVQLSSTVNCEGATGSIVFKDGAAILGTMPLANNVASLATSVLTAGSHSLTAVYSGDSIFASSTSSTLTQVVNLDTSSVAVVSSLNPSMNGQNVIFTATVSPSNASGTVTFRDGLVALGTGSVSNGVATFNTSLLSVGPHSITVAYGGDSIFAASTSSAISQTVNSGATTTTLTSSVNPVNLGAPLVLTATVTPSGATGTVTFMDGETTLGTGTLSGGVATLSTSSLSVGTHGLAAFYGGDSTNGTSVSGKLPQTVRHLIFSDNFNSGASPLWGNETGSWSTTGGVYSPTAVPNANSYLPYSLTDFTVHVDTTLIGEGGVWLRASNTEGTGIRFVIRPSQGDAYFSVAQEGVFGDPLGQTAIPQTPHTFDIVVLGTSYTVYMDGSATPLTSLNTENFFNGQAGLFATTALGFDNFALYDNFLPSTTTLSSSPNPSVPGQLVTLSATVSPAGGEGIVIFKDGTATLGIGESGGGTYTLSTSALSVGSHVLTAVYGGDSTYSTSVSSAVTQSVGQFATSTQLTSSANPSALGQNVTLTATISQAEGTGSVTFLDGATTIGTVSVVNGTAQLSTAVLSVGSHSLTAMYGGDVNNAGSTSSALIQTVMPSATTTSLVSSANPSTFGQSVILTATVLPATATGTVTFKDGTSTVGTGTLSGGTATFNISTLGVGSHSLTAVYGGDANDTGSTSSALTQTVNQVSTSTTLTSSVNPATFGQSVTFTATVSPSAATGTVTFKDGSTTLGPGTLSGGTATFSTAVLTVAAHSVTAVYGGDTNDAASTSSVQTQTVNQAVTTTTVISSSNPSAFGQNVTLTATVLPSTATGTVTFKDGGATLGTGTLNGGTATFSSSVLTIGSHSLTVVYGGDANDAASTSSALTQAINQAATTTTLTTSGTPSTFGTSVTFTATVSPSTAAGTVTFLDGATALGTGTLSGGTATFSTSALSVATHSLTAVYGGDTNDSASTSSALTQTVNPVTTTTTVTSSANPSTFGQSVTLTAAVSPSTATGTLTFMDGTSVLGTGTLSGGVATLNSSALTVAVHSLTAVYGGDTNDATSTSPALTQTVNKAVTTTTLTSSANPSTFGQSVTFTAAVSPSTATGTVTFMDGGTTLGTGTLSGGAATFSTSVLTVAVHSLTVMYGGDANSATSTSTTLSQTVSLAVTTTTLTSSANPSVFGQSVTFTATVTPSAATGTVSFLDGETLLGTGTLSNGAATFSTSSLSVASHSLTATYAGDVNSAASTSSAFALTVNQVVSNTSLMSAPNPSAPGQNVTLTAVVSPSSATGTVTFKDGEITLGSSAPRGSAGPNLIANGQLTADAAGWALTGGCVPGNWTLTGNPAGGILLNSCGEADSDPAAAQTLTGLTPGQAYTVSVDVKLHASGNPNGTSFGIFLDNEPSNPIFTGEYLDNAWHTATANFIASGTTHTLIFAGELDTRTPGVPSATDVSYYIDNLSVGQANGVATFTTSTLGVGSHSLTAVYDGDANDTASTSGTLTQTVALNTTLTSLTSSPNPSLLGQQVTISATISPSAATGTVTFKDGETTLGTGTIGNGVATFATTALMTGQHSLTAVYGGDSTYAGSTSAVYTHSINQVSTTISVTATPSSASFGQAVTFTATVFPSSATGTVVFRDGSTSLGNATLSGGLATFTPATLVAGSHPITAVYGGDSLNAPSTSAVVNLTVNPAVTTISLSSTPNPVTVGQPASLRALVSPSTATGTVTFKDGSLSLGTATLSSGNATITSSFGFGAHNLSAVYSGDVNNAASTSATVTQNASYPPLLITTGSLPTGLVNQPYGPAGLAATGGSGALSWSASGLPDGLGLSASGSLSGTPTSSFSGPVTFAVTDNITTFSTSTILTLSISAPPLTISGASSLGNVVVGGSVSASFTAGGGVPPYTWSVSGAAGVRVDSTGHVTGTLGSAGAYSLTLTLTDSANTSRNQALTASAFGITSSSLPPGTTTTDYGASVSAAGGTPPYSFSFSGLPAGISASGANLSGRATNPGSYPVSLRASDSGGLSVTASYTLSITGASSLQVFTTALGDATVGQPYSGSLSANGGATPYTWSQSGGVLPDGLTLGSGGTVSGVATTPGSYSIGVQVHDVNGSAVGTVSITVKPAPLTITSGATFPSGVVGLGYPSQILTASGGVPPYLFGVRGSLPDGLTLASSQIGGTPTTAGNFGFTLTVSDSATTPATGLLGVAATIRAASPDAVISTSTASFSLTAGTSSAPSPASVTVASSVVSQNINFSATASVPWLDVSGASGTPGVVSIGLNNAALALTATGSPYAGSVVIACTSTACAGKSQTVSVTLTVTAPPPQLTLGNTLISFAAVASNPQASSASLGITNSGGGSLRINSVTSDSAWLSVGSAPTTVAPGPGTGVTLTANPAGLSAGYYRATVSVVTSNGSGSAAVTLFISAAATMTLSPSGTQLSLPQGGALGNASGSFSVSSSNGATVPYTASVAQGGDWLQVSGGSGTATAVSAGTIGFSVNPTAASALAVGAYYGTIRVSGSGVVNSPQDFQVILSVTPSNTPVVPDLQPAGLVFVSSASGAGSSQTISVFASSRTPVSFQASASSEQGSWLSFSPQQGSASASSPGAVTVTATPGSMPPGSYRGTITFSFGSTVRAVNATLIIQPNGTPTTTRATTLSGLHPNDSAPVCGNASLVPTQTGLVSNFSAPTSWPTPLAIKLFDSCGSTVSNAQIVATFTNGDPPLPLTAVSSGTGVYSGTWTPRRSSSQITVTANVNAPGYPTAAVKIAGQVAPNTAPVLAPNGAGDVFHPQVGAGLGPGNIVQIYGTGLASQTSTPATLPLPTTMNGTSVLIGGIKAPLFYISPGQINAQIPFELAPGNQYQLIVNANGALTTPQSIQLNGGTPAILNFSSGAVVAQHLDGSLILDTAPAVPGEFVVIYSSGLGATDIQVPSGAASPTEPLARVADPPVLTLNGNPVGVLFAGLTPGLVGLYQINFQIPVDMKNGNYELVLTQSGTASNKTVLSIQTP